jgi:hypothetical protein
LARQEMIQSRRCVVGVDFNCTVPVPSSKMKDKRICLLGPVGSYLYEDGRAMYYLSVGVVTGGGCSVSYRIHVADCRAVLAEVVGALVRGKRAIPWPFQGVVVIQSGSHSGINRKSTGVA